MLKLAISLPDEILKNQTPDLVWDASFQFLPMEDQEPFHFTAAIGKNNVIPQPVLTLTEIYLTF